MWNILSAALVKRLQTCDPNFVTLHHRDRERPHMVSASQTALAPRSERSHARKMPLSVVNVKERTPETDSEVSRLQEELRRNEEKAKKVRARRAPRACWAAEPRSVVSQTQPWCRGAGQSDLTMTDVCRSRSGSLSSQGDWAWPTIARTKCASSSVSR